MTTSTSPASKKGVTPRTLAGAGLLIALLAVSYSLVEAQGARGMVLAGAALLAFGAGAVELRSQLAQRRRDAALQLEALEAIAREAATLPAAARALEEASERVSVLEQRLAESHSEATQETLSVVRSGLLEFESAMKAGIENTARVAKQALAPLLEEAVRSTVTASSEGADRLVERMEQDSGARRESEEQHFANLTRVANELIERAGQDMDARRENETRHFESLTGAANELVERAGQDMDARRESETRHFESLTGAAGQLVERLDGQDAAEARQHERATALLSGIEEATEALRTVGGEQREALEAAATASIERARDLDDQAAARFESLAALVNQGSEAQSERLARFDERLAEAQRSGAVALGESLASATRDLGENLSATGEAVRGAAELVQAGGAEMTAVAEQFGASVERQQEAANQWLESLGQIEGAVDEAGRGAAVEALDKRLAATQEIFATQLEFQRELFRQLRELQERVDGREAAMLAEEAGDLEAEAESGDQEREDRANGSGDLAGASIEDAAALGADDLATDPSADLEIDTGEAEALGLVQSDVEAVAEATAERPQ